MQIHDIKSPANSRKKKVIVGRGRGSGRGKTSGRGHGRNQNARAGRGILNSLEGGQIPLIRRLPKVGFRRRRPTVYQIVKLKDLTRFKAGSVVDAPKLKDAGLIHNIYKPFKILGDGELKSAVTVCATSFSKSAAEKITQAGGQVKTVDAQSIKKQQQAGKT